MCPLGNGPIRVQVALVGNSCNDWVDFDIRANACEWRKAPIRHLVLGHRIASGVIRSGGGGDRGVPPRLVGYRIAHPVSSAVEDVGCETWFAKTHQSRRTSVWRWSLSALALLKYCRCGHRPRPRRKHGRWCCDARRSRGADIPANVTPAPPTKSFKCGCPGGPYCRVYSVVASFSPARACAALFPKLLYVRFKCRAHHVTRHA